MGTWNTKIDGNDTFQDIYQNFFSLYNQGQNPVNVSKQILDDFDALFNDDDDRNNSLFGLALAQWETKSLDPRIYKQVKEIIESGNDLEVWKSLGADEKSLQQRKAELDKFLLQITTAREKPIRRKRPKFKFSYKELVNTTAPDSKKTFTISEHFVNGSYEQTGSAIMWATGGGSILYFTAQGLSISARWVDSQTLEVKHDKAIVFTMKEDTFFYDGDQGKVIYIEE
jgi:hypothetical protein